MSELKIKRVPAGEYPAFVPHSREIYKVPTELAGGNGFNQLINITRLKEDVFVVSFWTWDQDLRYKLEKRGTWYKTDIFLNKKQLHAFQHFDFGGMKIAGKFRKGV
jgi:hypothetical protein